MPAALHSGTCNIRGYLRPGALQKSAYKPLSCVATANANEEAPSAAAITRNTGNEGARAITRLIASDVTVCHKSRNKEASGEQNEVKQRSRLVLTRRAFTLSVEPSAVRDQLHGVTLLSIKVDCVQLHKGIVRSKCHNSDNFPSSFTAHNMANGGL